MAATFSVRACSPDFNIGAGETLTSIQELDFSQDWEAAMAKLIAALSANPD